MAGPEKPSSGVYIAFALCAVGAAFLFFLFGMMHRPSVPAAAMTPAPSTVTVPAAVTLPDPETLLDNAKDSTVLILHRDGQNVVSGSGFCVGNSGVIVTNAHVVVDQSGDPVDCVICFFCGSGHEKAITVPAADIHLALQNDGDGNDANIDLAVLKIDPDIAKPLAFGDSEGLRTTQNLYAVGFPHGTTVMTPSAEALPDPSVLEEVVQRLQKDDAGFVSVMQLGGAMTHGDSGGPVIDQSGNVVGVCESVEQDASIGYAIPSLFVKRLIEHAGFPAGSPATPSMTGPVTLESLQAQLDSPTPGAAAPDNTQDETEWETYVDPTNGFALEYPKGWTVDPPSMVGVDTRRIRIENGKFTSVVVDVSPTVSGKSAKDTWQGASDGMAHRWHSAYQLAGIDDYTLDGESGAIWMFTLSRSGEPQLTKTDIGVDHNGKGYALLCTAPSAEFKDHIEQFGHIVDSFSFAPKSTPPAQ